MEFKSKYFKDRYSFGPTDYDLNFMHFYIDIDESNKYESNLIDEDLLSLKEYSGENCFKLYFNDVKMFNTFKSITGVFNDIKDNIYLRIRNDKELFEIDNSNINIIIDKNNLHNLSINNNYNIVLQIDTIKELSIEELDVFLNKYHITSILVGQICYIGWDYSKDILDVISKFNISNNDCLTIEKNVLISNDFYKVDEYKKIIKECLLLIRDIDVNDKDIDRFIKVYKKVVRKIFYDNDGVANNKIENQTLIGGLFNNKCVCEGYCKILQQLLSLVNIESSVVGGNGPKESGGHLWNQVKIDDIWYNVDVTYDSYLYHNNKEMMKCLVSDKEVYKTTYKIAKKCDISYDWDSYEKNNNTK